MYKTREKFEDISRQHFKKIKQLGKGNFGEVFLIKSKETQKEYALKEINKKFYNSDLIMREVNNFKKLDNPNVVSFKAAFESEKQDKRLLNIIIEYADNGDLNELLRQQKEYFEETITILVDTMLF